MKSFLLFILTAIFMSPNIADAKRVCTWKQKRAGCVVVGQGCKRVCDTYTVCHRNCTGPPDSEVCWPECNEVTSCSQKCKKKFCRCPKGRGLDGSFDSEFLEYLEWSAQEE